MTDEMKQLIEDAARLLGLPNYDPDIQNYRENFSTEWIYFNPLDPERGDLMKVAMAAELCIDARENEYFVYYDDECLSEPAWFRYTKGDHNSLALAVLRAASAVLHSRGGV